MKKIVLSVLLAAAGTASMFAQGTVTFANAVNTFATTADRYIYQDAVGAGGTLLKGTQFKVQLYAGLTAADAAASLNAVDTTPSNMRGQTTTLPGVWTGGLTSKVIPAPIGTKDTDIFLQIRAWDSTGGIATYEQARASGQAIYTGASTPFLYHVPADGSAAGAYAMENFRAFAVVIPEPSTFALAGLGILGLVMARRRK
jgi:hypothetical protein